MGLVDTWWVSGQVWTRHGKTLIFILIPTPGSLLQEAQVQHGSRCPAQECGQVGAGDRTKGKISGSLDDQYLTIPSNYVFTPALLPTISHV